MAWAQWPMPQFRKTFLRNGNRQSVEPTPVPILSDILAARKMLGDKANTMAGLNHDFLLLPDVGNRRHQYQTHINDLNAITLHDDILGYFKDTLKWMPSENPANPTDWCGRGLNWYGPTAISGDGARVASLVFETWAEMFSIGPPNIALTGCFSWTEGESPDSGSYDEIAIERSEMVSKCRAIAKLAVQATDSERWLLHVGI